MDSLNYAIGTKLEIEIIDENGLNGEELFISQLIDIIEESILEISTPIHKLGYKKIPPNSMVNLYFHIEDKGLMRLNCQVIENFLNKKTSILLKIASQLATVQRRQQPRYDFSIDMKYQPHNLNNSEEIDNEVMPKITTTKNISAGGVLAILYKNYPKGTLLDIELIFVNISIRVVGEVVRSTENKYYQNEFETGIKFIDMDKTDLDFLVRYLYEMQKV